MATETAVTSEPVLNPSAMEPITKVEPVAPQHPARIQVAANKKPLYFYVNLAKRLLQEHSEVQLSALGMAVSTLVTVAEILKKDKLAVIQKLTTSLDTIAVDGRQRPQQKPKMEIIMVKSPEFDDIIAAAVVPEKGPPATKEAPAPSAGPVS